MIVLDASVLIAHLDSSDAHHKSATELLVEHAAEPLGASPITLAEVLVGPARAGLLDKAATSLRELAVQDLGLNSRAPVRLAQLRVTTGLKLPDCCVILAAEQSGGSVATFDESLARAGGELGLRVVGTDHEDGGVDQGSSTG